MVDFWHFATYNFDFWLVNEADMFSCREKNQGITQLEYMMFPSGCLV